MASSYPPFPLVKSDTINSSMVSKRHRLNNDAERIGVCMSDMAGLKGLGVHKVRLPPNGESTEIHYHLQDSEWLYVLSGTGILLLQDASGSFDTSDDSKNNRLIGRVTAKSGESSQSRVEEHQIASGDFMGFQGGILASKFAHSLRAGPEGLEYLMGGTRERVDVCCYPRLGIRDVFEKTL
ncbi:hypothetical protein I203_101875 [Kwoniella mangroviensis CBS 8507]|uniref:uncharacterized protein n=1 Tax=Kwoniella mangroviensis CBS 8507 TaxID=1296122 RepID=UPI00080CE81B|nr:uncharacterized protein I203_03071 [Kwoniella mangroviensis CBS 8507]OCF67377.1 hypothetical protein I203_03071 [Kwoniella mangroviensis CBS 8507]